jgi:hypothetical protein
MAEVPEIAVARAARAAMTELSEAIVNKWLTAGAARRPRGAR